MTVTVDTYAALIVEALDRLDTIALVLGPSDRPGSLPTILAANSSFRRRVGDGRPQGNLSDLLLPDTSRASVNAISCAVRDGAKLSGEILLDGHAGSFWLGFSLTTLSLPGGPPRCVLIGRDISNQMRRGDDDRAMQRVLTAAFVSVDAAVAVVTAGGRLVTASQGFATLCGRTLRALTGSALSGVFDPEVLGRVQRTLAGSAPGSPTSVFRGGGVGYDGAPFSASFSLSVIEGRANERLAVLTLHSDAEPAEPEAGSAKPSAAVGKIHLVGLQEIKATLGPKWAKIADRAMSLAEAAIRRRLGKQDVLSRTADQGFLIWFHNGTVEDNAGLASRIARDVRIALLTEFSDSVGSSVASATVPLPQGSTPGQLPASAQSDFDRHPGLAPDPAVESARAYLAWAETELPVETEQMFGRSGQPLPAVWCSLPDSVAARLEQAGAALDGESLGAFEMDLLRLRVGVAVAAKAAASKLPRSCYVPVSCAFLTSPRSSSALKEVLGGIDAATGSRLTLLLGGPFADLSPARLQELAAPLSSRVRAIGLAVQSISDVPLNALQQPFSVVSFQPGVMGDVSTEADLWQVIGAIHRTGSKVFARRIATPRHARMLLELGADFVCGTAPAAMLS